MAIKNGKTRPSARPYEIWQAGDWTWKILKFYSNDLSNPHARVLCEVTSPHTMGMTDVGDVYYAEIVRVATLTLLDDGA